MRGNPPKDSEDKTPDVQPRRVRLPGFVIEKEVGLGDAIKRATMRIGIRPCDGCRERAQSLNRWLVFAPRERK